MRMYLLSSIAFGIAEIAAFAGFGHDAEQVVHKSPDRLFRFLERDRQRHR